MSKNLSKAVKKILCNTGPVQDTGPVLHTFSRIETDDHPYPCKSTEHGVHWSSWSSSSGSKEGCQRVPWNGSTIYNSLITVIYNIKQNRIILLKETNVEFKLLVLFSICLVLFFLKKD